MRITDPRVIAGLNESASKAYGLRPLLPPNVLGRFKPRFRFHWQHGSWLPNGSRRSRLERENPMWLRRAIVIANRSVRG